MRGDWIEREGNVPQHIGIIMDGNGRWAKQRLLSRSFGHKQGARRMIGLIRHAFSLGVQHVTLYALSTENLKRPKQEVEGLFSLCRSYFDVYSKRAKEKNVRIRALGERTLLPKDVQAIICEAEERTAGATEKSVNVAVGYGGRNELVHAVNAAVERGEKVTESSLKGLLYTEGIPDPDLIIRTGGEKRLSNFLLYQAAYSELYFSDRLFPDFSNADLRMALRDYSLRHRRFGKTEDAEGNV